MHKLDVDSFLALKDKLAVTDDAHVFDVRTPAEFEQGHIIGAKNLPLFTDEERVQVGTTYKKKGREKAILLGLDFIGPKMRSFVDEVIRVAGQPQADKPILMHCWRGGMRSSSVSWLMNLYGFEVRVLEGGYKAWRGRGRERFDAPLKLRVISGRTGSGKTDVLEAMEKQNTQVLHLEGLAHHRGSAFGAVGLPPQPTVEQYENLLHEAIRHFDVDKEVWIEDESRMVGRCRIPEELWGQLRKAPAIFVASKMEARLDRLVRDYGDADKEPLRAAFTAIEKRLGGQNVKAALQALDDDNVREAAVIALKYYDQAYDRGKSRRIEDETRVAGEFDVDGAPDEVASRLLASKDEFFR
ncbi:MAG: tRNA 2-selenouridine(34) synthase MnmH [Deltaproteobacteria bacterium]|nr:tRNA 2-selenouridine(34) synthase MnmH [Deltaproteobacteria bacterium]